MEAHTPQFAVKGGMELRGEDEHPDIVSAARRREQDRDDYNNEIAGREVGRIRRFLPDDARPDHSGKRAKRESNRVSALLSLLQSDPAYAALYSETLDKLREAEAAAALALSQATSALDQARTDLADALDGASTLADGTRVFRDQNGDVWTEGGQRVEGDALDEIVWREGTVSHEEFLARKKAVDEGQRNVEAILQYQVEILGDARDRLMNEDDPPSMDEMKEMQENFVELAPDAVLSKLNPDPDLAPSDTANLTIPKLGG